MRLSVLIALCFLFIMALNLISLGSTQEIVGDYILTYKVTMVSNPLLFSLICFSVLLILTPWAIRNLRKPLIGKEKLKRIDIKLTNQIIIIGLWGILALLSKLYLSELIYSFRWTLPYFTITLLTILLFLLVIKFYIRRSKPDFLIIENDKITHKTTFRSVSKDLADITIIEYNTRTNAVEIRFKDGLDTISLFLTDFDINSILKFLHELNIITTGNLNLSDNFKRMFKNS